jgi:hypothetical protein
MPHTAHRRPLEYSIGLRVPRFWFFVLKIFGFYKVRCHLLKVTPFYFLVFARHSGMKLYGIIPVDGYYLAVNLTYDRNELNGADFLEGDVLINF